jgi:HEAT repeat protein
MTVQQHSHPLFRILKGRLVTWILAVLSVAAVIASLAGVRFLLQSLRTYGPLNDATAAEAVAALQSPDASVRRETAERLASTVPDPRRREIARALRPLLIEEDMLTRLFAARALGKWGNADDVPALANATTDDWPKVRFEAIEALGHIKGRAAAAALVQRLAVQLDRPKATQALKAIGPEAEPLVLPLLQDRDNAVRLEACRILGDLGSANSIPALEKAMQDSSLFVAGAARDALQAVQARQ